MKRLITLLIPLLTVIGVYAIPEVKVYSTANYGLELKDVYRFNGKFNSAYRDAVFDDNGNFYFLSTSHGGKVSLSDGTKITSEFTLIKFSSEGEVAWIKQIDHGGLDQIAIIDGHLLLPMYTTWREDFIIYDGLKYTSSAGSSYFLLKVDMETGSVVTSVEIEKNNFVEDGFDPFYSYDNGYAISPEGDLWFMFDINEDYNRVNKDYPVSFSRYGDNDKCLFVLSKDLQIKHTYCLGSDKNDETEFVNDQHLSPFMIFAGDTLFMYVPFLGKECNISLDPANPQIATNKTTNGKASAAFCKYLVKGEQIELLAYNEIKSSDSQVKRLNVNSKNKVIATQPLKVWDGGDDSYYEILPDMTLKKLEGSAYTPMWFYGEDHTFWFDQNDDIIKVTTSADVDTFDVNIVLPKYDTYIGMRAAKYDGKTLQNKWVVSLDNTKDFSYCQVDANQGLLYIMSISDADYDPSDNSYIVNGDQVIARYIETYRIKTSSEHVSIVVNGGNDMVRHGEDAEIVITPEAGFHIESVSTAKGDKVDFSWDGRCSIKNVTEPIELVITTGDGENSVDQVDAVALGVYPNPVKDILNVDDAEGSSYEVIDLAGNVASAGMIYGGKIATPQLAKGTYVLTIKKEIGAYSTKIIKE